jgi:hypothetical protein
METVPDVNVNAGSCLVGKDVIALLGRIHNTSLHFLSIRGLFNLTKVLAPPVFANLPNVQNSKFEIFIFFSFFGKLPFYKQKLNLSYPACWDSQLGSRFRAEGSFRRTQNVFIRHLKHKRLHFSS